ncbi:uncharacterized protein F4822DRAFT_445551 [Hypoxylon trugodes]|uniref:uncharacterized protein n=1 Tax=Hypoxylon trugodes TaxID=326681 RepID=UPI00218F1E47|nr:uncharacterized protein F4822DRAFT_445551 [Hypoxylon trugodes]KAI1385635.1 hypothetical protein F4822DRAFT_445551 [Hypoxylon trugodes]
MALVHGPDMEALRKRKTPDIHYREYFLWPHINIEDLSQPNILPLLLNSRSRNYPSEFSGADEAAFQLGRDFSVIVPIYLEGYTMIMNAPANIEDYGKLIPSSKYSQAFSWFCTSQQYSVGEGLLVLEIQERLLGFLVDCSKSILHDIPAEILISDTFPVQANPGPPSNGGLNSLSIMAAEAPYRVPANLDLARLESLLEARMSAAEDHLWALREDPNYFSENIFDEKEHQEEVIKDSNGETHPEIKPGCDSIFWVRVITGVLLAALINLEVFSELHRQARNLRDLQKKHEHEMEVGKDLPQEYLLALLQFRWYATQVTQGPVKKLSGEFPASPQLRKYHVRHPSEKNAEMKADIKLNDIESKLLGLLRTLWPDYYSSLIMGIAPLFLNELERLIGAEKPTSELISRHNAAIIGDINILTQCVDQVNMYLPWARTFDYELRKHETDVRKAYSDGIKRWGGIVAPFSGENLSKLTKLCNPSDRRFYYSIEGRRTKDNVEMLQKAEDNLAKLWGVVDQLIHDNCPNLHGTKIEQFLSQIHNVRRIPEWIDRKSDIIQKPEKEAPSTNEGSQYGPSSTIYIGVPAESADKLEHKKPTTKTKGVPNPTQPSTNGDTEEEGGDVIEASISLDPKSLRVFGIMLSDPAETSNPGEIAWKDLLHAMTATELFEVQKLTGSIWEFRRTDGPRKILLHKPHPRPKIPITIAKIFAARFQKMFGRTKETFVLKEKKV